MTLSKNLVNVSFPIFTSLESRRSSSNFRFTELPPFAGGNR